VSVLTLAGRLVGYARVGVSRSRAGRGSAEPCVAEVNADTRVRADRVGSGGKAGEVRLGDGLGEVLGVLGAENEGH